MSLHIQEEKQIRRGKTRDERRSEKEDDNQGNEVRVKRRKKKMGKMRTDAVNN